MSKTNTNQTDKMRQTLLDENDKTNKLGGNEKWGDKITEKEDNTTRIYFHNIRNLTIDDEWQSWTDMVEKMKSNSIDIFGFVEPNVNWTKKSNVEATKPTTWLMKDPRLCITLKVWLT